MGPTLDEYHALEDQLGDRPNQSEIPSDHTIEGQQTTENDLHGAITKEGTAEVKPQSSPQGDFKAYKHAHTILMIYEPPYDTNQLYVPVKLSLCPTVHDLFATVAQAWDLPVDHVSALEMRFPSFQEKRIYEYGVMRLKRDMEGPFECFLDAVENEEYWNEEGGACRVSVKLDVQRKEG
ncbi:MAG: hypothetical protein Q9179_006412 [Wetmoreana sp. 5 TL-2023]